MTTRTVHLVYPHGPGINCPVAIGRELGQQLSARYQVRHYDWDEFRIVRPGPNDVLLGHPHPNPMSVFRRSAQLPGWQRIIAMSPFAAGGKMSGGRQCAFIDRVMPMCDLYLAITGNYWFQKAPDSIFAHWKDKMVHLDLAVNRDHFPWLKHDFNAPGQRRFLYIGGCDWPKNTAYLSSIGRAIPDLTFGWIGSGKPPIEGLQPHHGRLNFTEEAARRILASYDFIVTVGTSDANPATILEAMAWGLIPVCTEQSGYTGYSSIPTVPLDDVAGAAAVLRALAAQPTEELFDLQEANSKLLDEHFNWDRFAQVVVDAIQSTTSPPLNHRTAADRLKMRYIEARSSLYWLRPANLKRFRHSVWATLSRRLQPERIQEEG